MTDALTLAAELEQITAAAVEWRLGCPETRTYMARRSDQQDAQRLAAQYPDCTLYRHEQRIPGLDLMRQAAELLRAQHALLNRRSAAARRPAEKARLSVSPAELDKIRTQLVALQARLER